MAARKGLPAKLAATDADDTRYDFRNLVVGNTDGTPRGGVTSPVGVNLLSSTATMNVAVAAFNAVAVRDSGAILLSNDGPVNVLLDPAPASNSRIDVIYIKQNDASSTVTSPDADNTPLIAFAKGTASASPTKPSIPTGGVEVGTVLVPAGATATNSGGVVITTTCPYTAGPGGVVPFRTLPLLQAWTAATPQQQASVFADTLAGNNVTFTWSDTGWRTQSGLVLLKPTSATGGTVNADGSVSFTAASGGIAVDGIFSSTFDNYVIEFDQTTASANTNLQYVERSGGTDNTSTYFWSIIYSTAASVSAAQGPHPDAASQLTAQAALYRHTRIEVAHPADPAVRTMMIADDASTDTSAMGQSRATGWHGVAAAFDGFKLKTTVGTITGKLRVYGISNG